MLLKKWEHFKLSAKIINFKENFMRKMALDQAANVLNCKGHFPEAPIQGYCTDSRLLNKGELFFALKGEKVDGHAYLNDVQQKGALAAVVSKEYQGDAGDLPLLVVEDPLAALQMLAKTALLQTPVRVVAITGSIGKTSTKEFTKTLLSTQFRVASSPGNSNSQVGIPLAILNHSTGEEEIIVLEMGMTEPGNLTRLVQIAPPEVAVITNVALVHAWNFESIEEIAWAKAEILSHPDTRLAILYQGIPNFSGISRLGNSRKISFSTTCSEVDFGVDPADKHLLHDYAAKETVYLGPLPVPGKHNLHNLLAAVAVARYFEIDWQQIKEGISKLELPERRLQFIRRNEILFLNDSYNATELSVKAALETLPQPEGKGRKIAVLGSMMELGKFSDDCHHRVGEHALDHVEELFCLGDECTPMCEVWKNAGRPVSFFKNRSELIACLRERLKPSDIVLLKGSRSKELWKILDEL